MLVEGPAERMLVPYFVRSKAAYKSLRESYVTWLEIAGMGIAKARYRGGS